MITLKTVAAIPSNSTVWDKGKGAVSGFGARRQKGDAVAYVVKYRTADGRQRWATIGRHRSPWTPDLARAEALRLLAEVVAAFIFNIDLDKIADDLVILDKRMKPEKIAAKLRKLAREGPFSLIIGDTLQALFDGDDLNSNTQTGEFMRRWRALTQIKGDPAVVIAAHPVKNAQTDNLVPYGGCATLNEVDGNLTLNVSLGGVTQLHWQGKLRGVEFEPVKFRFEGLSSPNVRDVKGREVQLPVLRPMTEADVEQREKAAIDRTSALLKAVRDEPCASLAALAMTTGIPKASVDRILKSLNTPAGGKLVKKTLGKWQLTAAGRQAIGDEK
jgi:hypothetical protein